MEIQQSPSNNYKHSPSKSPNTFITRMLRPSNGPSKSPLFAKQSYSRNRNASTGSRTNENLGVEYNDDTASFPIGNSNLNSNQDFAGFYSMPFRDFSLNGSLNPSPYKQEYRGFSSSIDRNVRRPFESPFAKFCDNLSPLQSRGQTPLSHMKNLHTSSEQILRFPFGSPMIRPDDANSPFPFKNLPRQKLDFTGVGQKGKEENKMQKLRDDCSFNGGSECDANEHYTEDQHRQQEQSHEESAASQPFKFNIKFQKSKYTASNPFPVMSTGSQVSKNLSQASKTFEDNSNMEGKKSENKNSLKVEESPNSPARKSMRRLYNSSNMFTNETNHTLDSAHYSDKMQCEHSYGTSSHIGSAIKNMSDEDPDEHHHHGTASASKKKVICNCKKSKCLKLYCDCFAAGEVCGPECNCCSCHNNEDHNDERNSAMLSVLDRNPTAFRPKIDKKDAQIIKEGKNPIDPKSRHNKGCNCKKSGCLKKYCECYAAGVKCSELCKCETCKNMDHNTIIKKAQNYNHMAYLNSGEKSRQYSEGSNPDCDSCCSHMHHDNDDGDAYESDPEYQVGRYSSKKVKIHESTSNMLRESAVANKRSMRLREVTPSKRNQRGYSQSSSPDAERGNTHGKKMASLYRTPYTGGDSSKKLNFAQHTPSPSKHQKTVNERNTKKLTSKLLTTSEYQSHQKVKSEY